LKVEFQSEQDCLAVFKKQIYYVMVQNAKHYAICKILKHHAQNKDFMLNIMLKMKMVGSN